MVSPRRVPFVGPAGRRGRRHGRRRIRLPADGEPHPVRRDGQGHRLVRELRIEEQEARVGHVQQGADAGDPDAAAHPLEHQEQRQHVEQAGGADDHDTGLPRGQAGSRDQVREDLDARVVGAGHEDRVGREQAPLLGDVQERHPMQILVEHHERSRSVQQLHRVEGHAHGDHDGKALAAPRGASQQPHGRGQHDGDQPHPPQQRRTIDRGARQGVRERDDQQAHRSRDGDRREAAQALAGRDPSHRYRPGERRAHATRSTAGGSPPRLAVALAASWSWASPSSRSRKVS